MKNLKKVLAFAVAFVFVLGFAASAATFPDVDASASYAEAVSILSSLKIMVGDDQGNFRPEDSIKRSEACAIIVRAKGLEDAAKAAAGTTQFTDVAADHWASGYINIGTQSGIVNGMGDGTFRPDDSVTFEQTAKMIVAALGFEPKAKVNGGYPTGYLVIASQEGITKGVSAGGNATAAKRSTVARMVFNALEVKMFEQTGFVDGKPEYAQGVKTLLANYLKVDKYEGYITSNFTSSALKSTDKKDVTISHLFVNGEEDVATETFAEGVSGAGAFLGQYVVMYVQTDDITSDDTVVACAPKTGKNKTLKLDYSQVDSVNGNMLYYWANSASTDKTTTKAELAGDLKKFFNGRTEAGKFDDFIDAPLSGTLLLIDNNNNDVYDYGFVVQFTNEHVVKEIVASSYRFETKDGSTVYFDPTDETVISALFNADGTQAKFEDVAVGDVISIAESEDTILKNGYISKAFVEGVVKEKQPNLVKGVDDPIYKIGDKTYKATLTPAVSISVSINDNGKFYLNVDNRIVYKEADKGIVGNYAFLYGAQIYNGISNATVDIKFLTAKGEWLVKTMANNVNVYVDTTDTTPTVRSYPTAGVDAVIGGALTATPLYVAHVDGNGNNSISSFNRQMFKYDTNSQGQVNRIYLVGNHNASGDDNVFSRDASVEERAYSINDKKLGSIYFKDDCPVFAVPEKAAINSNEYDEEDFSVKTVGSGIFSDGNIYSADAFDSVDGGYPTVAVAYGATVVIDEETKVFVVDAVSDTINAEGSSVQLVYGYQNGSERISAYLADDVKYLDRDGEDVAGNIEKGDVIIFGLNNNREFSTIKFLMKKSEADSLITASGKVPTNNLLVDSNNADPDNGARDIFGIVTYSGSGNIQLENMEERYFLNRNVNGIKVQVYEVDLSVSNLRVKNINPGDVLKYDDTLRVDKPFHYAYVRLYDDLVVDAVVYKVLVPAPPAPAV